MGMAKSWEQPGRDNWILAANAYYVVGSSRVGGMGAPEMVPFGKREAADAFVREYGGSIRRLDEIEDALVLSPVDMDPEQTSAGQQQKPQTGSGEE
jgi:copper chaperone NosL